MYVTMYNDQISTCFILLGTCLELSPHRLSYWKLRLRDDDREVQGINNA